MTLSSNVCHNIFIDTINAKLYACAANELGNVSPRHLKSGGASTRLFHDRIVLCTTIVMFEMIRLI